MRAEERLDLVLSLIPVVLSLPAGRDGAGRLTGVRRMAIRDLASAAGLPPRELRACIEEAFLALAVIDPRLGEAMDLEGEDLVVTLADGPGGGRAAGRPPRLTFLEALALTHHLESVPDGGGPYREEVARVLVKVRRALRGPTGRLAGLLATSYAAGPDPAVAPEVYRAIGKAIASGTSLRIDYRPGPGRRRGERTVWPVDLVFSSERWFMLAQPATGGPPRRYRVDRLRAVSLAETGTERPGAPPTEPSSPPLSAEVLFTGPAAVDARERFPATDREEGPDGSVLLRWRGWTWGWFAAWVLGYGTEAEVLGPVAARRAVAEAVGRLRQAHGP